MGKKLKLSDKKHKISTKTLIWQENPMIPWHKKTQFNCHPFCCDAINKTIRICETIQGKLHKFKRL